MTNKTNIEADNARMSEEIKKAILDGMNNLQSTCDCIVREFESKWEQQAVSDEERAFVIDRVGHMLKYNERVITLFFTALKNDT